jgi:hypothetical protein
MTAIDLLIGSFVLYALGCLWVIWMLCKRIDQWREMRVILNGNRGITR